MDNDAYYYQGMWQQEQTRSSYLEADVRRLQSQLSLYQSQAYQADGEVGRLKNELSYANRGRNEHEIKIKKLQAQRDQLQQTIEKLQVELENKQVDLHLSNTTRDTLEQELFDVRGQLLASQKTNQDLQAKVDQFKAMQAQHLKLLEIMDQQIGTLKDTSLKAFLAEYKLQTGEDYEFR